MTDLTKRPVAPSPGDRPAPPRAINVASLAVCVQVAFAVVYVGMLWLLGDQLRDSVLRNNAESKKPSPLCDTNPGKGCIDAAKSVRAFQIQTAIGTVLIAVAIVFLLLRIRRGIRSSRTLYIVVTMIGALVGFVGSPLNLLAVVSSGPIATRAVTAVAATAAVTAIVFLLRPESTRFFDEISPRSSTGAPRPGLGSLFRPRPPAVGKSTAQRKPGAGGARGTGAVARGEARAGAVAKSSTAAASRAKGRTDEAAVARGAALARSRAKASKSRRTER